MRLTIRTVISVIAFTLNMSRDGIAAGAFIQFTAPNMPELKRDRCSLSERYRLPRPMSFLLLVSSEWTPNSDNAAAKASGNKRMAGKIYLGIRRGNSFRTTNNGEGDHINNGYPDRQFPGYEACAIQTPPGGSPDVFAYERKFVL
jgi:hypothetical protein